MNENILRSEFAKFGEIYSVKIMWPRLEREMKNLLTGFVCFTNRKNAEQAKEELNGKPFYGIPFVIQWGKHVPEATQEGAKEILFSDTQKNKLLEKKDSKFKKSAYDSVFYPPFFFTPFLIVIPSDFKLKELIDKTAVYVSRFGSSFEGFVSAKEKTNSSFSFLFDSSSPLHFYYRWRVYSLLNGDNLDKWLFFFFNTFFFIFLYFLFFYFYFFIFFFLFLFFYFILFLFYFFECFLFHFKNFFFNE